MRLLRFLPQLRRKPEPPRILPIDPREQALLDRQRAARGIRTSTKEKNT